MIKEKEVLVEDKNGLQILIGQSIKVLKIACPLLIILMLSCGITLIVMAINLFAALSQWFAMIG